MKIITTDLNNDLISSKIKLAREKALAPIKDYWHEILIKSEISQWQGIDEDEKLKRIAKAVGFSVALEFQKQSFQSIDQLFAHSQLFTQSLKQMGFIVAPHAIQLTSHLWNLYKNYQSLSLLKREDWQTDINKLMEVFGNVNLKSASSIASIPNIINQFPLLGMSAGMVLDSIGQVTAILAIAKMFVIRSKDRLFRM